MMIAPATPDPEDDEVNLIAHASEDELAATRRYLVEEPCSGRCCPSLSHRRGSRQKETVMSVRRPKWAMIAGVVTSLALVVIAMVPGSRVQSASAEDGIV